MTLRTRLLLGYGYLVALIVLSATGAALGFHRMGTSIGVVLTDNFDSVRAATRMIEMLERQDSGLLALLLGDPRGGALVASSEEGFLVALDAARDNITLPEEGEVIATIGQRFAAYRTARERLLAASPERPLAAYHDEAFPRFDEAKTAVLSLLELNHQAMRNADRDAQQEAARRAILHGLLVLVALVSLAAMSSALSRHVLDRLRELEEVAVAIESGDTRRRADASRADELGFVGRSLNATLDRLDAAELAAAGRLAQQRQLLLALLASLPVRAALVDSTGEIMATTLVPADRARIQRLLASAPRWDEAPDRLELGTGDDGFVLDKLTSPEGRRAGWLARPA